MDDEKISLFRSVSRQYSDASILMHEAIARAAGLSGTDHKYLGLLLEHGEMTAGEFSRLTDLTTGAVTGLIDRLEAKNLLKRKFNKSDRRKVIIVPNINEAMSLLNPHFEKLNAETAALLTSLSVDDLNIIQHYFISATAIMKKLTNELNE